MPSRWQVNLRLSRDDYEYIRRKADEQGQTVTALLRDSAFATTMRAPDDPHAPDVVLIDATTWCGILRELNHWGVNYNQAVHAFVFVQAPIPEMCVTFFRVPPRRSFVSSHGRAAPPYCPDLPSMSEFSSLWLGPPNSTSLPWCTTRSTMAAASLSSANTVPHLPNSTFVVKMTLLLS